MASQNMFGTITVNGKNYIKRPQIFPFVKAAFSSNGTAVDTSSRLVLPGIYDFMLFYLTRDTIVSGASTVRRFLFRFGNSDGAVWYQQAGNGGTQDRVLDNLIFGNAQFPYALPAPIVYGASSNIMMEFQDISNQGGTYDIQLAFHGVYLVPA